MPRLFDMLNVQGPQAIQTPLVSSLSGGGVTQAQPQQQAEQPGRSAADYWNSAAAYYQEDPHLAFADSGVTDADTAKRYFGQQNRDMIRSGIPWQRLGMREATSLGNQYRSMANTADESLDSSSISRNYIDFHRGVLQDFQPGGKYGG